MLAGKPFVNNINLVLSGFCTKFSLCRLGWIVSNSDCRDSGACTADEVVSPYCTVSISDATWVNSNYYKSVSCWPESEVACCAWCPSKLQHGHFLVPGCIRPNLWVNCSIWFWVNQTLRHFAWPEKCPDLFLIEYLWDYLEERVKHQYAPQTLADLHTQTVEKWAKLKLTRHWWHSYLTGLVLLLRQGRCLISSSGSVYV